jgi:phenylalanyl-tRNA synthetase beta chain
MKYIKSPPLLKGGSPAGEGDFDFFIDLDIKINRGDALGYYGLARDLSVYYKIPLVLPQIDNQYTSNTPDFKVTSPDVIRVMTAKVSGVKVSSSPDWLKSFLQTHDINSINNLVDLSNYIMLLYGIPCHTFDDAKVNGTLTWENNTGLKYPQFTTLDGTIFNLTPANLLLTNQKEALSTDFLGGRNSGVDQDTQATFSKWLFTIAPVSVLIHKNSRPAPSQVSVWKKILTPILSLSLSIT